MRINLDNRYGAKLWLERLDKGLWILNSEKKEDLGFMRIIYKENGKDIEAIDPSGGPFLSVGTVLEGYIIEEIYPNGYVLKLKEHD